ncbi:hypothetical protein HPB49_014120 [Dermacentor silvarum]|uniref:Uncharacterized protein n=1 Tax=Dermacentor silvarum TaxID=543639 RepID=A0ACB8CRQ9_DERSI|nr:hypothetical protein HPB49_014120 [Dermacentor silvarum]
MSTLDTCKPQAAPLRAKCFRSFVLPFHNLRKPKKKHRKDVSNFDKQFTSEKIELTPTDKLFMMNLDQTEFMGFSFLNPEFVQHV